MIALDSYGPQNNLIWADEGLRTNTADSITRQLQDYELEKELQISFDPKVTMQLILGLVRKFEEIMTR